MFQIAIEWQGVLLRGLGNTLMLFALSGVVTVAGALLSGAALVYGSRAIRISVSVYIEVFRGTSAYVQLFWMYYALPLLGVQLSVWGAAVLALGLNHAAYGAGYVKGCLEGVPKGQFEAAASLGLGPFRTFRSVTLPQAAVPLVPLFTNEFVLLLKGTAIASLVTLPELTDAARAIVGRTFMPVPTFAIVLTAYFLLSLSIVRAMKIVEGRVGAWRAPRAEAGKA